MFKRPDTTYKVSRRIVERIVRDEANPLHRIACIIENDSTVLDVGAGNGLLGLVLAKLHKNVMIDAIEPNKAGVKEIEVPPYRRICTTHSLCVIFIIVAYSIYSYLPTMYVEYYTPTPLAF